jgi:diaminopimelate epimerase
MNLTFYKYQGAGNDFILVDQRLQQWLKAEDEALVERLCDRHFGIGADGLILLEACAGYDFAMTYFNADGRVSTMCGNGGRCLAAFAKDRGMAGDRFRFLAADGPHEAVLQQKTDGEYWVELKMSDVQHIQRRQDDFVLNTGSPHFVRFTPSVESADLLAESRAVRYSADFDAEGVNVNLVECAAGRLLIRTYERGVEDETLACGTGVTAAALAFAFREGFPEGAAEIPVQARGGALLVRFRRTDRGDFSDIWLCGPAKYVFHGQISL